MVFSVEFNEIFQVSFHFATIRHIRKSINIVYQLILSWLPGEICETPTEKRSCIQVVVVEVVEVLVVRRSPVLKAHQWLNSRRLGNSMRK